MITEKLVTRPKGGQIMGLLVILLIALAFLAVIFTSGYNDKPEAKK